VSQAMRLWPRKREKETVAALDARRTALVALVAAPAYALPEGEAPPTEFKMLSAGVNHTEKGDFVFDADAAEACMSFWGGKGVELSFDYEHQSLQDPPIEAPAAGWWTPEVRDGALYATNIRWTARAAKYLSAKEYRYFSPAFNFDKETGQVLRIINCALTNNPAMDNIAPLVRASANTKENDMPCESCTSLTAKLTAAQDELTALKAKLSAMDDTDKAECTAVGLSVGARPTERLVAVQTMAKLRADLRSLTGADTDAGAIGAITAWKTEAAQVATLKAEAAKSAEVTLKAELDAAIADGVKTGKLMKADNHPSRVSLLKAAMGFGGGEKVTREGVDWLKAHIAASSPVVKVESEGEKPDGKDGEVTLTAVEAQGLTRMGLSAETGKKAKAHLKSMGVPVPSDAG